MANGYFFVFDSILDWYNTQGMCDKIVSEIPLLIICCSDWYKTQKMSCKAVDDSLATLKLVIRFFYCFIGRGKYI